jgi:hypothetical protein
METAKAVQQYPSSSLPMVETMGYESRNRYDNRFNDLKRA